MHVGFFFIFYFLFFLTLRFGEIALAHIQKFFFYFYLKISEKAIVDKNK